MLMTARDALHELIDQLPENQTDLARHLIEDPRDAADLDGEPLDSDVLASLDRGIEDQRAGRLTPLDEYERKRVL